MTAKKKYDGRVRIRSLRLREAFTFAAADEGCQTPFFILPLDIW